MQLKLRHLAPYLPYGLKVKYNRSVFYISTVSVNISPVIKLERYHNHRYYNEVWLIEDNRFKPILRPLSDLTKEIKHNGESIVPIIEILKIKHPPPEDHKSRYGLIEINSFGYPRAYYRFRANYEIMVNTNDLDNTPYWIIKKLIEWKFDVFGLIDTGIAISVQSLFENPLSNM